MSQLPAIQVQRSLFPAAAEWTMLQQQATIYVKSGFLPSSIKSPEQAITIAMKGWELGIPPMHAFAHIHLIQGKPSISSELMLALIYSKVPGAIVNVVKSTDTECTLEARRPGAGFKISTFTFDEKDAISAQLVGKDNWKKNPKAMYRARAISAMARLLFADALMGCSYTPEELDPSIVLDEEGNPLEVEHRRVQEPVARPTQQQAPTPKAATPAPEQGGPTRAQMEGRIRERMGELLMTGPELMAHVKASFNKEPKQLTNEELASLVAFLELEPLPETQ